MEKPASTRGNLIDEAFPRVPGSSKEKPLREPEEPQQKGNVSPFLQRYIGSQECLG
jgi:hypothetical protein